MKFRSENHPMFVRVLKDGRLAVKAPIRWKDALKAGPGARWNKIERLWTFPYSWATMLFLEKLFGEEWEFMALSDRARRLLEEAKEVYQKGEAIKDATEQVLSPIPNTVMKPWVQQLRAYHFAKDMQAALLMMRMGTGKTKVAIDLMQNLKDVKSVLVIAPTRVAHGVWPVQLERHLVDPSQVDMLVSTGDSRRSAQQAAVMASHGKPFIFVTNYSSVWRGDLAKFVLDWKWDLIVLDEVQRIKSPGGKASKFFAQLSGRARRRIGLSGTPFPNGNQDAYAIYRFLDPAIFGTSYARFGERYLKYGGFNNFQIIGYKNEEDFRQKLHSIMLVVDEDTVELPEIQRHVIECEMDAPMRQQYRDLSREFIAEFEEGVVTAKNSLAKITKLQQFTSGILKTDDGYVPTISQPKLESFREAMEDLDVREPVVVFARFSEDLARIREVCRKQGRDTSEVSGNEDSLKEWQEGRSDVLVVQIQAGGAGLDLTRARYAAWFSTTYSFEDFEQTEKRLHRPGQTREPVFLYFAVKGTVDGQMLRAREKKMSLMEFLMERRSNGDDFSDWRR